MNDVISSFAKLLSSSPSVLWRHNTPHHAHIYIYVNLCRIFLNQNWEYLLKKDITIVLNFELINDLRYFQLGCKWNCERKKKHLKCWFPFQNVVDKLVWSTLYVVNKKNGKTMRTQSVKRLYGYCFVHVHIVRLENITYTHAPGYSLTPYRSIFMNCH